MNALQKARLGYGSRTDATKSPKTAEYEAFSKVTQRLIAAKQITGRSVGEIAGALHDNRRLWTVLALDVANDANPLPRDLRAQILYLSEFTNQHSSRVLSGQASVDPLIEINTAVMAGLRGKG